MPLARAFVAAAARGATVAGAALAPRRSRALARYAWPGNVRELRNAIERALVVSAGNIVEAEDLSLDVETTPGRPTMPIPRPRNLSTEVEDLERIRIEDALAAAGGNQSEAARQLGMSRGALLARLRAWSKR